MEEYTVHHRATDGSLILPLPGGGYGKLPPPSNTASSILKRLHAHATAQRRALVIPVSGTTPTDADGYTILSCDPVDLCAAALAATADPVVRQRLPTLLRMHALAGLGTVEHAKILKRGASGCTLRLPMGVQAVSLGDAPVSAVVDSDAEDDGAAAIAARSLVSARVLHYSAGPGVASCSVDSGVVQRGLASESWFAVSAAAAQASGGSGLPSWLGGIGSGSVVTVTTLLVCPPEENEARSALVVGEFLPTEEASILIYVDVSGLAALPALGAPLSVVLVFVPPDSFVTVAPFCVGVAGPAALPRCPAARCPAHMSYIDVPFEWRSGQSRVREQDTAKETDDSGPSLRKRRLEEAIDRFERQGQVAPTDPAGFEKLLLADPNDSYVWTRFMAHHVQQQKVEEARNVAERALQRISPTAADERFNVWTAYLSLENLHGTAESLAAVFRRALQQSDDTLRMHNALAEVFTSTGKKEQLLQLCRTMSGKYKNDPQVWERLGVALIDDGKRDQIRRVFKDMSRWLNSQQQALVGTHVAIHEYKSGDPNHGRALFEGLVQKLPKKSDIWFAYTDQEVGLVRRKAPEGTVQGCRALFERLTTIPFPPKSMQQALTRHLTFEQAYGGAKEVEAVKLRAKAYVESRISGAAGQV